MTFLKKINKTYLRNIIYTKKIMLLNELVLRVASRLGLGYIPFTLPVHMEVELSNKCNLACAMCPRPSMKRKVGTMSFEVFKKVMDQTRNSITLLWLHLFGEPLLTPELLLKAIDYSKKRGVKEVAASTNAMLLTGGIAKKLLTSKMDRLLICIDGATKKTHEALRKGSDYDVVVRNVKRFFELKKRLKNDSLTVVLQIIKLEVNKDEIEAYFEQWKTYDCEIHVKQCSDWSKQIEGRGVLLPFQQPEDYPVCQRPWMDLSILWDGRVSICCRDVNGIAIIGNINKDPLKKVWNSKKMRLIRKFIYEGKLENISICKNCDDWMVSDERLK
ncbi:MAG: radical SAM protein [Candidatus Woesearchaeota archaeon]